MNRNYLLTYETGEYKTYDWFETEEDMNDFIEIHNDMSGFSVIEKTHVLGAVVLD